MTHVSRQPGTQTRAPARRGRRLDGLADLDGLLRQLRDHAAAVSSAEGPKRSRRADRLASSRAETAARASGPGSSPSSRAAASMRARRRARAAAPMLRLMDLRLWAARLVRSASPLAAASRNSSSPFGACSTYTEDAGDEGPAARAGHLPKLREVVRVEELVIAG